MNCKEATEKAEEYREEVKKIISDHDINLSAELAGCEHKLDYLSGREKFLTYLWFELSLPLIRTSKDLMIGVPYSTKVKSDIIDFFRSLVPS